MQLVLLTTIILEQIVNSCTDTQNEVMRSICMHVIHCSPSMADRLAAGKSEAGLDASGACFGSLAAD